MAMREDAPDEFEEFGLVDPEPRLEPEGKETVEMEVGSPMDPVEQRVRAIQAATRKAHVLDGVPVSIKRSRVHQPSFMKNRMSARAQEKQLDKELPSHSIPDDEKHLDVEAEGTQWNEHVQFEAVRPLSLAESEEEFNTVKPDRILNSRFL